MPNPVVTIKKPYRPELLAVVQHAIEKILEDGGEVYEFGSGHSTVWFAQFSKVVSVESDEGWYKEVRKALRRSKLKASLYLVEPETMAATVDAYDMFDLILVDCVDAYRNDAVYRAMPHVKPGGWLILDDSQWPMLARARKLLSAWPWTIVKGMHRRHSGDVRDHQTSLYRRPDG